MRVDLLRVVGTGGWAKRGCCACALSARRGHLARLRYARELARRRTEAEGGAVAPPDPGRAAREDGRREAAAVVVQVGLRCTPSEQSGEPFVRVPGVHITPRVYWHALTLAAPHVAPAARMRLSAIMVRRYFGLNQQHMSAPLLFPVPQAHWRGYQARKRRAWLQREAAKRERFERRQRAATVGRGVRRSAQCPIPAHFEGSVVRPVLKGTSWRR